MHAFASFVLGVVLLGYVGSNKFSVPSAQPGFRRAGLRYAAVSAVKAVVPEKSLHRNGSFEL